ncbi:MAG: cytochrome b/b6 domain-containing protein [Chloroflexota bacterium]
MSQPSSPTYPRFRVGARVEHAILMVSFTILALTGLPQKYVQAPISVALIDLLGGIEQVRIIHRAAAFLLVVGTVYHLLTSAYRFFVKHERMQMLPTFQDARDLWDTIRYNLGLIPRPPRMAKFNFGEKMEYWAVVWGTAIMVMTGFILWNPIASTAVLPGQVIPAALTAHGAEAVLAVLSILIWHFYNVHLKHFNPSMFSGRLPRHQMEEEHALELARLEAGGHPWPELSLPVLRRRRQIFIVLSVIVGGLMLAGLVWAFTFEETAITTIPRVTREIFVPLGTPAP